MSKHTRQLFDRKLHYSIRKLTFGACSVLIGASLFGVSVVKADEVVSVTNPEETLAIPKETSLEETDVTATPMVEESDPSSVSLEASTNTTDASHPILSVSEAVDDSVLATKPLDNHYQSEVTYNGADIEKAIKSDDYLKKDYQIFPTPQKVTYGDGVFKMDQEVKVNLGSGLDVYTENHLKSILQDNNISYDVTKETDTSSSHIYLGIYGTNSEAEKLQENIQIDKSLYEKTDAYSLVVKDNNLSIVGKDTDAVFYGLTTLKLMLKENPLPILRDVSVEDYADVKNRGFIEGYYGNPWSNKDREELMKFGGDLKLNQYFFAPKDDPYHNSKWRELYPKEKLDEIRQLAKVGNETKTKYVWTIHPFMHDRIRFDNDTVYQIDLGVIKAKFKQLLDVGVREFGILADDAAQPVGGYKSYNKLMSDVTEWLKEEATYYHGLKPDMIFVPSAYWGRGREAELQSLNQSLPKTSTMTLTGGKVWGEVSQEFLNQLKTNLSQNNQMYRPVQLWINWPCTDNSKQHLILGGGEKFLHPNVDPSLIGGIMLNPMQQSEPSKVALFSVADYAWHVWKSKELADKNHEKAFNFIENGNMKDSETSVAFRELGKHMINQNMDNRVVKLEESIELAPKLKDFLTKLKAGEDVATERENLRTEFKKLKDAAALYKASGHENMVAQISYWLDNTVDQMDALDALLTATEGLTNKDYAKLWDNYDKGAQLYEQSRTHSFWYVDHYENAELGVQHIRPFIWELENLLAKEIETTLHPDRLVTSLLTNRQNAEGDVANLTDGDLSTQVIFKNPTVIKNGDYIGLSFNKVVPIHSLNLAMGAVSNLNDTFKTADLEYLNEENNWVKVPSSYTGNESLLTFDNLDIKAKAIRMIATSDKDNTWFAVREIGINKAINIPKSKGTITTSSNLIYKLNTTSDFMTDGKDNTESMLANADKTAIDTTPVHAWIQMDLGKISLVNHIRVLQGTTDKLAKGNLEYSENGKDWHLLKALNGEQLIDLSTSIQARYIRVLNKEKTDFWWRIANFEVSSTESTDKYTDTNIDSLKKTELIKDIGHYEMHLPSQLVLEPNQYIGFKLDRLHEFADLNSRGELGDLTLAYSPNGIEWYHKGDSNSPHLVRYVRLSNAQNKAESIENGAIVLDTKEVSAPSLSSTTYDISSTYGQSDVRKLNNVGELFDGDLKTYVEFADTPVKDDEIILNLGQERSITKIRAYIKDGTYNYLRDGKIQVSLDGKFWTDVVTVGDGQANSQKDDSLSDGWTHDAKNPGNRYIEGELTQPVKARYLRILATANYDYRFVGFTELVINDGEFVNDINDPTVEGNVSESQYSKLSYIVDGSIQTAFFTDKDKGEIVYHLLDDTMKNTIKLISGIPDNTSVQVLARVRTKDNNIEWRELGQVSKSFQTFQLNENDSNLLDIKLVWDKGQPVFYELATSYQDLTPKVEKADYSALQSTIEKIPSDLSGYTDSSVKALQETASKVSELSTTLPKSEQSKVDEAVKLLEQAIKGLEKKEAVVSQVTPTEGVKNLTFVKPELVLSTEKVPFKTVERLNDQLAKGQRRVITKGQDGEQLVIKEVYKDGDKVIKENDLPSLVSKEVVNEVVEVGTMEMSPNHPMGQVVEQTLMNNKSDKIANPEIMSNEKDSSTQTPVEMMSRVVKNHDDKSLPNTGDKETGLFLAGMALLGLGTVTTKRRRG